MNFGGVVVTHFLLWIVWRADSRPQNHIVKIIFLMKSVDELTVVQIYAFRGPDRPGLTRPPQSYSRVVPDPSWNLPGSSPSLLGAPHAPVRPARPNGPSQEMCLNDFCQVIFARSSQPCVRIKLISARCSHPKISSMWFRSQLIPTKGSQLNDLISPKISAAWISAKWLCSKDLSQTISTKWFQAGVRIPTLTTSCFEPSDLRLISTCLVIATTQFNLPLAQLIKPLRALPRNLSQVISARPSQKGQCKILFGVARCCHKRNFHVWVFDSWVPNDHCTWLLGTFW